jgi:hypothetical protein
VILPAHSSKSAYSSPWYEYVIVFGVMFCFIPLMIFTNIRKIFNSNERLREKIIYEFTEEKMKLTGQTFTVEMTWEKTYKIVEFGEWILIYQNRVVANPIAKESFGSHLEEFKKLIQSKLFIKQKWIKQS